MCGGQEEDKIIEVALSIEMFQTGILIHDDIIDNSETRRNKPSAYMSLGGDHFGKSQAICLGDLGFPFANELILNSQFKEQYKINALKCMNNLFTNTIYGEIMDVDFSKNTDIEEKDILDMYILKTSYYTIIGPLQIGAALAGADDIQLDKIREFGKSAGIMFQLKDDILGVYGKEEIIGKPVSLNIEEQKNSLLNIKTLEECEKEIVKYYENAFKLINNITNDEKAREIVIDLLKYLKERDK